MLQLNSIPTIYYFITLNLALIISATKITFGIADPHPKSLTDSLKFSLSLKHKTAFTKYYAIWSYEDLDFTIIS